MYILKYYGNILHSFMLDYTYMYEEEWSQGDVL